MQTQTTLQYEQALTDNLADLEKAWMALNELLNEYEWVHLPDAKKAVEYGETVFAKENCSKEAEHSWKYIADYKKIMWLVNVARDYCCTAIENCNKALSQ